MTLCDRLTCQAFLQSVSDCRPPRKMRISLLHVISRGKPWGVFADEHGDSAAPLDDWFKLTKGAHWRNFEELRATFPTPI